MRLFSRVLAICLTVPALVTPPTSVGASDAPLARLQAVRGSVVSEATVPISGRLHDAWHGWRSTRVRTTEFALLGLTWHGYPTDASVRVRGADGWSRWLEPDALGPHQGEVRGTELLWVPRSDAFQVRVDHRRPDLAVTVIDPGRLASDADARSLPPGDTIGRAPRPRLFTRDDWGADESWRNGGPWYLRTIKQVHVHHTATGNGYLRADVPGLIRGMYRYHTHTLGWSDIGYNFVVDRFGRIWVGRAGGFGRAVRGAHTLGFNHESTGVAVLGNYESHRPSLESIRALVRLAAWKLDLYDREPAGHIWAASTGSDLYRDGEIVELPVIDGHRDTNQTACPGQRLYDWLPGIRTRTQGRVDDFDPAGETQAATQNG